MYRYVILVLFNLFFRYSHNYLFYLILFLLFLVFCSVCRVLDTTCWRSLCGARMPSSPAALLECTSSLWCPMFPSISVCISSRTAKIPSPLSTDLRFVSSFSSASACYYLSISYLFLFIHLSSFLTLTFIHSFLFSSALIQISNWNFKLFYR